MLVKVWDFITQNWVWIPLVISEVAALLPSKFNGIIQSILKIGGIIFKKRN